MAYRNADEFIIVGLTVSTRLLRRPLSSLQLQYVMFCICTFVRLWLTFKRYYRLSLCPSTLVTCIRLLHCTLNINQSINQLVSRK